MIFFITLIAFNHFVRAFAGSPALGSSTNPTGAFPKTLGEGLSSVNEVRLYVGHKIGSTGAYCPPAGQNYCRTLIDGLITILGLS